MQEDDVMAERGCLTRDKDELLFVFDLMDIVVAQLWIR